ncbi:MAG: hypothetical protein CO090_03760 [Acidobacteria bacterium CG_4_9_14_3_um_filter_49_7]|nr:MAG: hypothetical protein CO090_03760 [Acidobacteria bacterium CG_4_9_14_3_um_filter_49_7]
MKHTQGKLPDDPTRTTSVRKLNGLTGTILEQLVTAESAQLHKPDGKFLMEGTMEVLLSGSTLTCP